MSASKYWILQKTWKKIATETYIKVDIYAQIWVCVTKGVIEPVTQKCNSVAVWAQRSTLDGYKGEPVSL